MHPNDEELRKYSGEWILVFKDKIVDHSVNLEEVLKVADEKYPADKIPEDSLKIKKVLAPENSQRLFIQ
jgi:hypothetical protein